MIDDPIERVHLMFSIGVLPLAFVLAPAPLAIGLALGALLAAVNFRALRRGAERLFAGELPGSGPAAAGFGLRFVMLGGVLAVAMYAGLHPVGLVLGLSLIVPAAVIGTWLQRPAAVATAPGPPPDDASWDAWDPWRARERDPDREEDA